MGRTGETVSEGRVREIVREELMARDGVRLDVSDLAMLIVGAMKQNLSYGDFDYLMRARFGAQM